MPSLNWFGFFSIFSALAGVHSGPHEVRLIRDLMANYTKFERPAVIDNTALKVEFQVNLQQIIDVDEKNQMINTNIWLTMKWNDYKLMWNPAHYGNITDIRLPQSELWKPDILMYNSADPSFDGSYPVNMVIKNTGAVQQLPPGIFTSTCPIQIKWFPFDDQNCDLKFGSWTYDGTKIDLQIVDGATEAVTIEYKRSGEWDLLGMPGKRNVVIYECCPDNPYIDLTFTIKIRRRKLFYMVNIVIPCLMLATLTLLTFALPPDAGEKIGFGTTILLSLTVFLLLVAEALPATSDAVPLIALYFACVMLMNAASVCFTVLVLNYHHRSSATHVMQPWVKKGICEWMAWILRMQRPGHELNSRMLFNRSTSNNNIEMGKRSQQSQSLLANIKNDDDYLPSLPSSPLLNGTDFSKHKTRNDTRSIAADSTISRGDLKAILRELQFLTDKAREQEEDDKITSDWQFAAMVVDRFLLWFFSIFTVVSALGILLAAPNIFSGS